MEQEMDFLLIFKYCYHRRIDLRDLDGLIELTRTGDIELEFQYAKDSHYARATDQGWKKVIVHKDYDILGEEVVILIKYQRARKVNEVDWGIIYSQVIKGNMAIKYYIQSPVIWAVTTEQGIDYVREIFNQVRSSKKNAMLIELGNNEVHLITDV